MTNKTIYAHATIAGATLDIHRQIQARYGSDPAILDDFDFKTLDCRHEGHQSQGKILAAARKGAVPMMDELFVAYYGATPPHLQVQS